MLKNTQVVPIREQIAEKLRTDIIGGQLEPGQRIREETLAERFGVSRGPIRDVLLQLTKEGLLVSKRNCGVTVNDLLPPKVQGLMIDLRLKIEIFALKSLDDKLEEDDFVLLKEFVDNLGKALASENFTEATEIDLAFHRYLIHRAGGDELANLWTPIVLRMRMNYQRITTPEQSIQEHMDIVNALKDGDMVNAIKALKANIR